MDFEVTVNPFLQKLTITTDDYSKDIYIDTFIDEWSAFKVEKRTFDVHITYDEKEALKVCFYEVVGKEQKYQQAIKPIKTIIKY